MKLFILALLLFGAVNAFSAEGLKIGDDAKEFSLKNIDGSMISLKIASLIYIKNMPAKVTPFWQSIRMIPFLFLKTPSTK